MNQIARQFLKSLGQSGKDLLPIALVIAVFQIFILRQALPNVGDFMLGSAFILVGLTLFVYGLKMGLFPIGEAMAYAFIRKKSLSLLLIFAFALGFGVTIAEPDLIAVVSEAAKVAQSGGVIDETDEALSRYQLQLRYTIAVAVGLSILIGVLRILRNWKIQYIIIFGYLGVLVVTAFAPDFIVGIAYDSGGVTTSTITVPLVTALGVGLASSIRGRNPLIDGFGMIAIASLLPIIAVMIFGIMR